MKEWWTVKELAAHYGLAVRSVYDLIAAGKLVPHRFGKGRGGIRVSDSDRREWEERCRESVKSRPRRRATGRVLDSNLIKKQFGL